MYILHCGTNNLRDNKKPEEIAKEILNLALKIKTEENDVMISGIAPRTDNLDKKREEVNKKLKMFCEEANLEFISNSNLSNITHLNGSGLHLNFKGTLTIAKNFTNAIKL